VAVLCGKVLLRKNRAVPVMMDSSDARSAGGSGGPLARASVIIATVFGVGYAPIAPGTWGTAAAIPMVWAVSGLPQWVYLALCAAVTLVAIAAAGGADRAFGEHDAGKIVIDEVAGYFWTMAAVGDRADPVLLLAGFVLFRAADILKPPPARAIDRRLPGGPGVVLDDVVAGWWAAAALWGLQRSGLFAHLSWPG
jgi:phosphatidylglycerophosphatase A